VKRPAAWAIAAAVGAASVGLAVALGGIGPLTGSDVARPACHQLPNRTEVVAALADHPGLTTRIEAAGDGVHVTSTTPCADEPDRALVTITYRTSSERAKVDHILTTQDGFGVPAELVKD
jgi:hypothetical protein